MAQFNPAPPDPQTKDKVITGVRTAVAAIPFVGGSITELWSGFFSSPLAKRREAWLHELASAVAELHAKIPDLSLDALQQNEAFISAVLNATSNCNPNTLLSKTGFDVLRMEPPYN